MRLARDASSWMHPGETHLARCIYTNASMDASFDSAMFCHNLVSVHYFEMRMWMISRVAHGAQRPQKCCTKKKANIYQKTNSDILLSQNMWVYFGWTLIATNPFVWTFKFRYVLVFLMLHICTLVLQKQCAKTQRQLAFAFTLSKKNTKNKWKYLWMSLESNQTLIIFLLVKNSSSKNILQMIVFSVG